MYTADLTYHQIQKWSEIGLRHPAPVAEWIDADKALNQHLQDSEPSPRLDPANIAEYVEAKTKYLLYQGEPRSQAIQSAREAIKYNVISTARENIDAYTTQLTKRFNAAAKTYVESSRKLPEVFVGEDLAGFDTETFTAYQQTKEAAAEIMAIRGFLASIYTVAPTGLTGTQHHVAFLVIDPGTPEVYSQVQFSAPASTDRIYEAVDPLMLKAVRAGAQLRMATPTQRNAECAEYETALAEAEADRAAPSRTSVLR